MKVITVVDTKCTRTGEIILSGEIITHVKEIYEQYVGDWMGTMVYLNIDDCALMVE